MLISEVECSLIITSRCTCTMLHHATSLYRCGTEHPLASLHHAKNHKSIHHITSIRYDIIWYYYYCIIHSRGRTYAHMRMHSETRAHARACVQTQTNANTQTHTYIVILFSEKIPDCSICYKFYIVSI